MKLLRWRCGRQAFFSGILILTTLMVFVATWVVNFFGTYREINLLSPFGKCIVFWLSGTTVLLFSTRTTVDYRRFLMAFGLGMLWFSGVELAYIMWGDNTVGHYSRLLLYPIIGVSFLGLLKRMVNGFLRNIYLETLLFLLLLWFSCCGFVRERLLLQERVLICSIIYGSYVMVCFYL